MKRLVMIIGLILLLALAACDTMGPTTQELVPTEGVAVATQAPPLTEDSSTGEQPQGEAAAPGADLQGVTWEWVSLIDPTGQTTSSDPTRYTITFNPDGMAPVLADCNTIISSYITDGLNLEILSGPATLMACPEDTQDQLFTASLTAAESYIVQDGELFITIGSGAGTMIFRSAPLGGQGGTQPPAPTLTGVTWEWVSLTTPMETITAADPARYTITFNDDGTANVVADCNSVTATYTAGTDSTLAVVLGASTAVACPEDSQAGVFTAGLSNAAIYSFIEGDLIIDMPASAGTMLFRASGTQASGPSLTGVTWEWIEATTSLGTTQVVDPTRYTILFNDDGTANIKADCNSVLATYTDNGAGALTLALGPSTLAACPPDSQVDIFTAGLGVAGAYSFADGDLLLINPAADGGVLRFRAAITPAGTASPDAELTDIVWEWVSTTTPAEEIAAADPTRYRITFNTDGTANLTADCNVGNAAYTVGEDGSMTITLGVSTLAFCENSQDAIFREGLAAAATYALDGGDLVINLANDGGAMRFRNGGAAEGMAEPPATGNLTGTTWEWVKTVTPMEEIAATDQTRYNIVFNEDGSATIKADCNTGVATYTAGADGALTITPGGMTLMMCPDDSQATRFMADLTGAAIYFFQDGNLFIDLFASSGTMQFAPATVSAGGPVKGGGSVSGGAPANLTGTVWQMTLIQTPGGNLTINDPARYAVTFNADGSANIKADCNSVIAAYTIGAGNMLTITPGPSTMAYCGPGSFDQIFVGGLTNAMGYRLEDGNLLIDMLYESGSLVFMPAN